MVTEALSSEETTVEAAITAVSGLSSYFSAVVALAVAAAAITAADVAAAADLHFYCGSFRPAAFYDFSVFFFCLCCNIFFRHSCIQKPAFFAFRHNPSYRYPVTADSIRGIMMRNMLCKSMQPSF